MNDDLGEVRLFLEGVTCDLFFFEHLAQGLPPESIRIRQEVYRGSHAFADIEITTGSTDPYFVEIDVGYSRERILESLRRKYSPGTLATNASRVIVVVDSAVQTDRALERAIHEHLRPGLQLELWNERQLLDRFATCFGVTASALTEAQLLDIRQAIDHAKGVHAFGDNFSNTPLEEGLLWQLAFWRLRRLRESGRTDPRAILTPGNYPEVVVVFADLCSYSSYVRDTRDDGVVRQSLTAFSSKSRYRVINDGGFLYQFQGDSVIGLFGVPEAGPDHVVQALECARRLIDIGASVANEWQRRIDRIQSAAGVHIAMAIGTLQMLSLRPLSRTHIGGVADAINLAARLNSMAECDEIVVSNVLYQRLPPAAQRDFRELEPIDARNVGRVRAWKMGPLRRDS
jgi:class 3 adenylate cyclase